MVRLHNFQEDTNVSIDLWDQASGRCVALKDLLGDSYDKIKVNNIKEVTLTTVQEKTKKCWRLKLTGTEITNTNRRRIIWKSVPWFARRKGLSSISLSNE